MPCLAGMWSCVQYTNAVRASLLMSMHSVALLVYLRRVVSNIDHDTLCDGSLTRAKYTYFDDRMVVYFFIFYRATRVHSADCGVARCLSVRPSVGHTPVFCRNG